MHPSSCHGILTDPHVFLSVYSSGTTIKPPPLSSVT
jgi:hypothetical protein